MEFGVFNLYDGSEKIDCGIIEAREYYRDLAFLLQSVGEVQPKSFSHQRLEIIDQKFKMHLMYNKEREVVE
jgi:AMP deaminase